MICERLRRAALVLLDSREEELDARDWASLEADNDTLVERVRVLEEELEDALEGPDNDELAEQLRQAEAENVDLHAEIDLNKEAIAMLQRETISLRARCNAGLAALELSRSAEQVEHESAVGALREIVRECEKRLPGRHNLFDDDKNPVNIVVRVFRNLASRGLQNDPVFMRDEKALQEGEKPIELDVQTREQQWSRASKEDGIFVPIDHGPVSDSDENGGH